MPGEQDGTWLEPASVTPLTGDEPLAGTGSTVQDFWSFALSDLKTNVARGVLAEFLVARAVGAQEAVRVSWDNFDVKTPDGIRIVEHGARSVGVGFLERYAEGPLAYDESTEQ